MNESSVAPELDDPAYAAALRLVTARQITPENVAAFVQFVLGAEDSDWYRQALKWALEPPDENVAWQAACGFIVEVVSRGFDSEQEVWWPMAGIEQLAAKHLALMDFLTGLRQQKRRLLRDTRIAFERFGLLVLGAQWEARYMLALEAMVRMGAVQEALWTP